MTTRTYRVSMLFLLVLSAIVHRLLYSYLKLTHEMQGINHSKPNPGRGVTSIYCYTIRL